MYNLDAAADRLRKASYQSDDGVNEGPKKFTVFLLDGQMGGWGFFFWYKTEKALLRALERDLVGCMYSSGSGEEREAAAFLKRIADVVSRGPTALQRLDALRKSINKLLVEPWRIPYIGTYTNFAIGSWQVGTRSARSV